MESLELYVLRGCPYCRRVKRTLDKLSLDYVTHPVPRSHAQRTTVRELSGQTEVPVLVDPNNDVDGMAESSDIIAYLETTYEYPEGAKGKRSAVSKLKSFFF